MATVQVKGGLFYPHRPQMHNLIPSYSNMLIDAAGEKAAFIVQAPRTGTIDRVVWRTGTVTTGGTVDVRLETVDAATGRPSGTLWGTNTNLNVDVADTDDAKIFESVLTAGATVTQGDFLGVVIQLVATGNMNIRGMDVPGGSHCPHTITFTGTWAKQSDSPVVALGYNDGTFPPMANCFPAATVEDNAFNTGTTPDEVGIKFKPVFRMLPLGFWHPFTITASPSEYEMRLYDSANNIITSKTVDTDMDRATSPWMVITYRFPDFSTWLENDSFYRLTMLPLTVNSNNWLGFTILNAAYRTTFGLANDIYGTERTNAGAWTDTQTKLPYLGLVLDQIEVT